MSGQGLDPLKRLLVKGLAGGIGLASESIVSYKERRKTKSQTPSTKSRDASDHEASTITSADPIAIHELPGDNEMQMEEEVQWDLDEAQKKFSPHAPSTGELPSYYQQDSDSVDLGQHLINRHPPPSSPTTNARLSQPVILPQRRPKTRQRGFIKAYAPALDDVGITQVMFLDFLHTFDTSTQASPWLDAINLASMGLAFIPHFPMVVSIAIQISVMAAKDIHNRTRTNAYLDKANRDFFQPRGLYCLVMTYSPDAGNDHKEMDVTSTIATSLNPSSTSRKLYGKLRESSGKTYGEVELPEAAPLVFPALDDSTVQPRSTKEKMEGVQNYVRDYYDKRAQANFAGKHAGSALVQGPSPKFTSRYADPNHPASSGSFRSLVTGGYVNPPPMSRQRLSVGNSFSRWDERGQNGEYTLRDHVTRTRGMVSSRSSSAGYGSDGAQGVTESNTRTSHRGRGARDNMPLSPLSIPANMVKRAIKKVGRDSHCVSLNIH
ncbi:hypothetical protein FZEAL_628 [Fusarium zealandicum]|uniref:Uncharacterized protein n=1 Tax=Fusarium zealandicum TaxID=1053134 RepID=A0A8H4UU99_9HYPO|nr:hypothetical protein FZEAL_628 [Fusarium zealandicum]